MSEIQVKPRRRWYQISLASLLWLTLVLALAATGIREQRQRLRRDAEVAALKAQIKALNNRPVLWLGPPKARGPNIEKLLKGSIPHYAAALEPVNN